ncbi:hypothetical protein V1514DRAFT_328528 [Lipomyces japonicus]|uniref:uncharacterized protein n=1 Tax=Lipomyces japonicus TaxID=56871 RepID=UPI0034CF6E35
MALSSSLSTTTSHALPRGSNLRVDAQAYVPANRRGGEDDDNAGLVVNGDSDADNTNWAAALEFLIRLHEQLPWASDPSWAPPVRRRRRRPTQRKIVKQSGQESQVIEQQTHNSHPKSWADVAKPTSAAATITTITTTTTTTTNSISKPATVRATVPATSANTSSLESSLPAIRPRGLVNPGNMCFMNSILQILLHCGPFYALLHHVDANVVHSFNSKTPILEALISFVKEFYASASAALIYGTPFTPHYLYDALRANPLFATMRPGHQEDAEEFLGFLLDGLHQEFIKLSPGSSKNYENDTNKDAAAADKHDVDSGGDWHEVGKNHKVALTRRTELALSPISSLFGGQFRSIIRAGNLKPSITLEPYQRVQLDISAAEIHTVEDALAAISHPEPITHYKSSLGNTVDAATKQTFFETLPSILILHLKRFQFAMDEQSGTVSIEKINKTVGYSRTLSFPSQAISPALRQSALTSYRLFGVVYHHGNSTEGGHYTVDLHHRQSNSWINLDDTTITQIRPEQVDTAYDPADSDQRTAYLLFYERCN